MRRADLIPFFPFEMLGSFVVGCMYIFDNEELGTGPSYGN